MTYAASRLGYRAAPAGYKEWALFRVISLNANGIRAAARKGFFEWMPAQKPDVVCIQETKAQIHQLKVIVLSCIMFALGMILWDIFLKA